MSDAHPDRVTAFEHGRDAPTIGASVHTTAALAVRVGRSAERALVRHLAEAFDRAELNYEIDYGYAPWEPPHEVSVCGDGSGFDWWNDLVEDGDTFPVRKDVNLLLFDTDGGGCAFIEGIAATAAGMHLSEDRPHRWIGRDDFSRNVLGAMHELGHLLGFAHSPHPGMGWNEGGEWHRTVTVSANGEENLCGEWVERREHAAEARHLYFHDCAIERMSIDSAEPLGPAGPESVLHPPEVAASGADGGILGRLSALLRRFLRRLGNLLGG